VEHGRRGHGVDVAALHVLDGVHGRHMVGGRAVRAFNDDNEVYNILCHNLVVSAAQGLCGIVGRHYDNNFLVCEHTKYL